MQDQTRKFAPSAAEILVLAALAVFFTLTALQADSQVASNSRTSAATTQQVSRALPGTSELP